MKIGCLLFAFTIINLLSPYYSAAQDTKIDLVAAPKYERWAIIKGIAQDQQGFMWFAAAGGLFKYDGYNCTAWHHDPNNTNSLAKDYLEGIYAGKEDFLLLCTYGAGLDRFDLLTGNFTHYRFDAKNAATISNDTVTSIIKDKQGFFWVGTHNGLNRFDARSGKFTRYKNNPNDSSSLSDNQVRVLFEDHKGILWVGTESPWVADGGSRVGGLNRFDPKTGRFTRYMHNPANSQTLISNEITAIFEDTRGVFWIGTAGDGLHTMNRDSGTFQRYSYDAHQERLVHAPLQNIASARSQDYITFITEDNKKRIWIGTFHNGINEYDAIQDKVIHFGNDKNSKEKLLSKGFSTAYCTRDGTFFISSWGFNLYKLNTDETFLPHNNIGKPATDFHQDNDGVIWIGTTEGLLRKNKDGSFQKFVIYKNISSNSNAIYAITGGSDQSLWLATFHGLYNFNKSNQKFTAYHHESDKKNSLLCDTVTSVVATPGNKLWVGTDKGLDLMDISSVTFKHYIYDPNISEGIGPPGASDEQITSIPSIAITKKNKVWLCVGGDVNVFDEQTERFKRYSINGSAYSIMEDSEERLWLATSNGLFKYDKETDDFIPFYDPLKSIYRNTHLYNIIEDHQKNLWFKTINGFIRLNVQKNETSVFENNGPSYSWPVFRTYITPGGQILSGDSSGYFAFYPDSLLRGTSPPNIVLTDFLISDHVIRAGSSSVLSKPVNETAEISLKHNQNFFSLNFASIDFTNKGEEPKLLYRLENFDLRWHKADEEGTATYNNVPPGKYLFRLKAVNSNGIWSEKNIAVQVAPPWWTRWWAYSIYALFFITALYVLNRTQRRRLIAKEKERTRENELQHAREIEKAYHELKLTQSQLIQSEKMASLGELTAGIAHEIQNPLNFVNNFSEVNAELIEELKSEKSKVKNERDDQLEDELLNDIAENERKINYHGKRADAIVKGMLQHSRVSGGKKEPTDINALADEYLRLSYHGLRAKDKSFNATIETRFDESIGKIEVVPQDIGRVLLNLFNNAFYAVKPPNHLKGEHYDPKVTVTTKRVSSPSGAGGLEIQVRDNGVGIPPKVVDKIFQPFFTTKPTGQGTGLGLSLSYDIIKAHGGEITVESKEGRGTEFTVHLPVQIS